MPKRKSTKHKATTRKAAKRKPARSKTVKLKAPARKATKRAPQGWVSGTKSGILGPGQGPVPASKLKKGLAKALSEIEGVLDDIAGMTEDFGICEVELTASFSADGKFVGIGVGGAASIKMTLRPKTRRA